MKTRISFLGSAFIAVLSCHWDMPISFVLFSILAVLSFFAPEKD